jgi:16S rRNA (guanine(966)-N(2))-methyltransferase RsmD
MKRRIEDLRHDEPPPKRRKKPGAAGRLRISGGDLRGRIIEVPAKGDVRPMLDKTRQALFNVLADDIKGARVWDCFAGTGLLALEALSRGAAHAVLIERSREHARVIEGSISALGLAGRATLHKADAFSLVAPGARLPHTPADFVFLDPPHAVLEDVENGPFWPWLCNLHNTPLVDGYTVLVIGHHGAFTVPQQVGAFAVADRRVYGNVGFTILVRVEAPDEERE